VPLHWLLMMQDRIGKQELRLTHQFLAEMLAVQRSTLTLAARRLQATGVIRYRRGLVEILDLLKETSCECYALTRSRFEQVLPGSFG
jgi:Mn-dependent DtxR family transcriptional regulator